MKAIFARVYMLFNSMGAYSNNRKRGDGYDSLNSKSPGLSFSNSEHVPKRQKTSFLMNQTPDKPTTSKSSISRFYQYPEVKSEIRREVHGPVRSSRFSFSGNSRRSWCRDSVKESLGDELGNAIEYRYNNTLRSALASLRYVSKGEEVKKDNGEESREVKKGKEVIDLDNEVCKDDVSEDSSIEEVEKVEDGREGELNVSWQKLKESRGVLGNLGRELDRSPSSVMDLSTGNLKVDSAGKVLDTLSLDKESDISGMSAYNKLLESARKRDGKLQDLEFQIQLKEKLLETQKLLRPQKKAESVKKDVVAEEAFTSLTQEEEAEVARALSKSSRRKVLVTHEKSNIDITGEVLQCLGPRAWLNDEVINLYLELLKERENREPQKFLKCHFFNTFFYKKLISGRGGYNFQSVRRWTSQKKLGYSLLDCDKIFVPIHKEIHWCLAVINKKDEKFQYLDSLGGFDNQIPKVLARYYVDEVKDKTGKDIDVSSWRQEFVEGLPEQENGFDCGMFMIKYADFYSRGVGLCFNQEHMPYFRLRTVKEILRLKAD